MKQDMEFEKVHRKIEQLIGKIDILQGRIREMEIKVGLLHTEEKRQRKLESEMWTKSLP